MITLFEIFSTFAYLALISIGGTSTIFPEMERQAVLHGWLTHREFVEIFAISQLAPGPNMLLVFLIGYRVASFTGALAAGMGMFIPTSCLMVGLAQLTKGRRPQWIERFHQSLMPITVGLTGASVWIIAQGTVTTLYQLLMVGMAAILTAQGRFPPAGIILGAVVLGAMEGLLLLPWTVGTLVIFCIAALVGLILVLGAQAQGRFRVPLIQNFSSGPMKQFMKQLFNREIHPEISAEIRRDRQGSLNWVTPLLLLLLSGQSIWLLWSYRSTATKLLMDAHASLSKPLTQMSEGCVVPRDIANSRKTYLQVCGAMQEVLEVPNGQFFYGGTMGAAALRSQSFLNEIRAAHPDFRLRYLDPLSVPPDSTSGIKMLINGDLSFAESQRPLREEEYQQATARGFTLKQIPVAMTGAAFYVHPDLHLPGLSIEQLQAIYRGEKTNWAELGGPDLPITPVSQDIDSAGSTLSLLQNLQNPLPGVSTTNDPSPLYRVRDTTSAIRKVAETPGAVGFGTQALVAHQKRVRLIGIAKGQHDFIQPVNSQGEVNTKSIEEGTYPLIQRIFVVIRQDGTLDEMAGTAYANLLLSKKGQDLISKAGYLPIRVMEQNP